jgi:lysophospholipase L1-like esterase
MPRLGRFGGAAGCLLVASCGGGSPTGPSSTPAPTPPPVPTHTVSAQVFYDENGNGSLDAGEEVRLPAVVVSVGSRSAGTDASGQAAIPGVPEGTRTASIEASSLPPYFQPGQPVTIEVPQPAGSRAALAATLPIGGNRPGVYMAFGDSITSGDGSGDGTGYRDWLRDDLRQYWGRGDVLNEGRPGSRSDAGRDRISTVLRRDRPAYTLILYGTNDWNKIECKESPPCFTLDSLRSMIRQTRDIQSLPVVGTIIPVNPDFVDFNATERNQWVASMNDLIRPMVREEGAVLAELHGAFLAESDLASLFSDRIHPNDDGYRILARAFFQAVTAPRGAEGSRAAARELVEAEDRLFTAPSAPSRWARRRGPSRPPR